MASASWVLIALFGCAIAQVAQVHDYIQNENCKVHYIRKSVPSCVAPHGCFPVGTDNVNNCTSIKQWQWQNFETGAKYAPGVNPLPNQRITHNGDDVQKIVWAYTGAIQQGEAYQVYNQNHQVTVEDVLNTPVNHITFIANVHVANSSHWFSPGENNTDGCGQLQTWQLPFGYSGHNATESLPVFQQNLQQLHNAGLTITLTMGSWCTSFPVLPEEEWNQGQFQEFVSYFEEIRQNTFGGVLDGIDWDWEGFCKEECLKGACTCGWDDKFCGQWTPEQLAEGQSYNVGGQRTMCWILPTKSSMQVMTGITHYMKQAGYVVTLAPMSTAVYTGVPDSSPQDNGRNEFVKWRNQPYQGGQPIDGSQTFNLLALVDGVLLQWYSGFDASLCMTSTDPHACTCDNVPDADYPNVLNVSNGDGLITSYFFENGGGGNMFPTTFPVRCQACGTNVIFPNGTRGNLPCSPAVEAWFLPGDDTKNTSLPDIHRAALEHYVQTENSIPYWWVANLTVNSKCPRGLDCPDWQYENEPRYSRQIKLLSSLNQVMDVSKVSIGFETLGIDVQTQFQAWGDPALPWSTATQDEILNGTYYHDCTQNMTKANYESELRCGQPLLSQQWGLKFNATDVIGLSNALKSAIGKELAGIGVFTLDGMMWTPTNTPIRYWFPELMALNQTFKIPCHGNACGGRGPAPPPPPPQCDPTAPGGCNVCSACCQTYLKNPADCLACKTQQCPQALHVRKLKT